MVENKTWVKEYNEQKKLLCDICKLLFDRKLVSGTDGNISMRVEKSLMLITPSGICKGMLSPDQILLQDFDENILSGNLRSSKEAKVHIRIYEKRADINAIVHTHPPASTSFAIVGETIPDDLAIELPMLIGDVALAKIAMPGTVEVVNSIEKFIDDHNAILLANHGLICYSKDLVSAFNLMDALENVALTVIYARVLGNPLPLNEEMVNRIHEKRKEKENA